MSAAIGELLDERRVVLDIIKETDRAGDVLDVGRRRETWERCWSENARRPYFGEIVRWHGKFYRAPGFEHRQLLSMLDDLSKKCFSDVARVAEFGCGAGDNLAQLSALGRWELSGYDWSDSAVSRVKALGFRAEKLDMFAPRAFAPGSLDGVLTVHAMEQLGSRFGAFFDMLLAARPKIVVHIEPLYELYDRDDLLDYLAMRYHRKRGYLVGFVPNLKASGAVEILELRRSFLGNMFHEAYGVIIWRPK